MKFILLGLLSLVSTLAVAANTASLEYTCELDNQKRSGKVEIKNDVIVGQPSCMYFGTGPTLCLRFERHIKINDIHLSLRTSDQLRSALDSNFITLGNIPYAEGATSINRVRVGLLKKKELSCLYTNVEWNR